MNCGTLITRRKIDRHVQRNVFPVSERCVLVPFNYAKLPVGCRDSIVYRSDIFHTIRIIAQHKKECQDNNRIILNYFRVRGLRLQESWVDLRFLWVQRHSRTFRIFWPSCGTSLCPGKFVRVSPWGLEWMLFRWLPFCPSRNSNVSWITIFVRLETPSTQIIRKVFRFRFVLEYTKIIFRILIVPRFKFYRPISLVHSVHSPNYQIKPKIRIAQW